MMPHFIMPHFNIGNSNANILEGFIELTKIDHFKRDFEWEIDRKRDNSDLHTNVHI